MDNAIRKIERRRWDLLSSRWHSYLPDAINEMPDAFASLSDDELLLEKMRNIHSLDEFESIGDAPKLRTLIFEAGRFSAERCLYFTRTAEQLVSRGAPTAALTASYLGMIFGSRAIQSFLGIHYCLQDNRTWMVDVWSGASDSTSQGEPKDWTPRILALISARRISHEHHWKIFIRIRSVTTRLPLDDNAMGVFRRLKDHGSYSTRRNDIQYNDHWPYADLSERLVSAEIGVLPEKFDVTQKDLDCDLKVAEIMAFCSAAMLLDVLSPLPKFKNYCSQFKSRLSAEWHPLINIGALASGVEGLTRS